MTSEEINGRSSGDDHERVHDGLIDIVQADVGAQFVDAPSRFDIGLPTESRARGDDNRPTDRRVATTEMAQGSEKARSVGVFDESHGQIHHRGGEYLGCLIREGTQPSQGGVLIFGALLGSAKSRFSIDGANVSYRLGHRRIGFDHQRSAGLETISPPLLLPLDLPLAFRDRGGGLGPAFLHASGEVRHLTSWLTVKAPDTLVLVEIARDPVEIPGRTALGIGTLHAPHVYRQTRGSFRHPASTALNEAHLRAVMTC